ncbi:MAG: hypothetical protein ACI4PF_00170, partial [Christensenellales bacterium]
MKRTRVLNKILFGFVVLIMCLSPILSGCAFSLSCSVAKLDTPQIVLHNSSQCITWDEIEDAKEYEVYCNDQLID